MINAETLQPSSSLFEEHPLLRKFSLLLLFLLAALIRLDDLHAPGLLLDREYTSAISARAFYFMNNDEVEAWRRDIAVTTMNRQPVLEPPLVEYLVSIIYRVMGREDISYSRYLTSAFWLVGGIFMFKIAKQVTSSGDAIFATIYYLFVPTGILISRSFQPDSLMMMLFLISLYLLIRHFEQGSGVHLIAAAMVTAITLLLRPLVVFAIFLAFLSMSLHKQGSWKKIANMPFMVFGVISLLPAIVYYAYGIVFAGYMRWKIGNSFMPHLLVKRDFWQGWFELGAHVAGIAFLVAAISGFFLLQNQTARSLITGLAISYFVFGVVFTYHIHTHDYYHIQLFPIIGLCAGVCLVGLTNMLISSSGRLWFVPVILSLLVIFYFSYRQVREGLNHHRMEDPRSAWQIGELIAHSPNTVFVSRYYGLPLEYYGEFSGAPWPVRIEDPFYRSPGAHELSVQERMDALGFEPEYFVITHFDLFQRKHQDLQAYLKSACSARWNAADYLIYTDCQAPFKESKAPHVTQVFPVPD